MSLKKSSAMKRVVHIARDHNEAKKWDIEQVISMTPEERQEAAKILKKRVFGIHGYVISFCSTGSIGASGL